MSETVEISREALMTLAEEGEDTLTAIDDPAYDRSAIEDAVEEAYDALNQ